MTKTAILIDGGWMAPAVSYELKVKFATSKQVLEWTDRAEVQGRKGGGGMRIITAFLIASAVFIWAFGWYGVAAVALFLLGAFGYAASGSKSGPVARFIERIGKDEKKQIKTGKR